MANVDKERMLNHMKSEVQGILKKEELQSESEVKLNLLNYFNSYSIFDYMFPLHCFFPLNEQVPGHNITYNCTLSYLGSLRFDFIKLMSRKYAKYLTQEEIHRLKEIEKNYFTLSSSLCALGFTFLIIRPIPKFRLLNFYSGVYFLAIYKLYSIYFFKDDIVKLRKKVSDIKPLIIDEREVLDYTLIPDWRTYLYYYRIL